MNLRREINKQEGQDTGYSSRRAGTLSHEPATITGFFDAYPPKPGVSYQAKQREEPCIQNLDLREEITIYCSLLSQQNYALFK